MIDFDAIPIVDVAPLRGGSPAAIEEVAGDIGRACETAGFLYVAGHGVPDDLIDGLFRCARWCFALPPAALDALDVGGGPNFRGYVPMGITGPGVPRRMLEAFQIMLELDGDDPDVRAGNVMYGPNRWPPEEPGAPPFRALLTRYYTEMEELATRLLRAFAIRLELEPDHFLPSFRKPLTQLRLLHYPTQAPDTDEVLGVEAHTDTGAFTILLQDDVAGLEVRNRAGDWIPATPIAGTFVINIADMMQRWTNGRFVSTPHRVANRTGGDRYSVPFFVNPDYDAVVEPLPSCCGADAPAAYDALQVGPYVEAAYRAAWPRAD